MQDQLIGMLVTGTLFALAGFFLTINQRFAAWGLSRGRARIWVKLFGQERALKLTRYVFGPAICCVGLLLLLGALVSPH